MNDEPFSDCENLSFLIYLYLKKCSVKITLSEVALSLETHPEYPSVWAISQTLKYFGVSNEAYKADYEGLLKIEGQIIVYLEGRRSIFAMLEKIDSHSITLSCGSKKQVLKKSEFLSIWQGVVIASNSQHEIKKVKIKSEKFNFVISSLAISLIIGRGFVAINYAYLLFLLNVVGFIITISILHKNYGGQNRLINGLCDLSSSFDCNLSSKEQYPFKIKGADLSLFSFVFFGTTSFLLFFEPYFITYQYILFIIQLSYLIGMPIVLFAITMQKFIIKKWCPLCLLVVLVFTIGLFTVLLSWNKIIFNTELLSYLFFIGLPTLILYLSFFLLKGFLEKQQKLSSEVKSNLILKRKPNCIASLFYQREPISLDDSIFTWGTENPTFTIDVLISARCSLCRKAGVEILDLLDQYSSYLQCNIYFDGVISEKYELINKDALFFASLKSIPTSEQKQIFYKWCINHSIASLKKGYEIIDTDRYKSKSLQKLNLSLSSIKNSGSINKVPFVLINHIQVPQEYHISDLKFLLLDRGVFKKILDNHPKVNK